MLQARRNEEASLWAEIEGGFEADDRVSAISLLQVIIIINILFSTLTCKP